MRLAGHLVEVDWDGSVLTARAVGADGREFLATGPDGRLTLTLDEIASVVVRDAPRQVAGVLLVTDTTGVEHRMHFRRPARDAFHALAAELDEALRTAHPETGPGEQVPSATGDDVTGGDAEATAAGVDLRDGAVRV
jgi:hypothetical protein